MRARGLNYALRRVLAIGITLTTIVATCGCSLIGPSSGAVARPTATLRPTTMPIPTWTPIPSPTPEPSPTPVPVDTSDCDLDGTFASDVTIPDYTALSSGEAFVKTWGITNTGTCQWGEGFWLVYVGGEQMQAPERVAVPQTAPGEVAEISVEFVAPSTTGEHRSEWQLATGAGEKFGDTVWMIIVVE